MNAEILDSTSSPSRGEVNHKPAVPSSSPPAKQWRMSILYSLGVLVLLASFATVAINLRSQASPSSLPIPTASALVEGKNWCSLGEVDIEGGKTPLYPLQIGRVTSIAAKEGEFVKAGAPLLRVDDTVPRLKVRQAESDLEGARRQLTIAEAGVSEADTQIEAQKLAIADARDKVATARILYDKQKKWLEKGLEADKETVQAAKITVGRAERAVQLEETKLAGMKTAKRKAEAYVAAAKELIVAKEAQLEEARNALGECLVRAPVDGTPLRILVTTGEMLGPNPRRPAIEFAAARPLVVRAEVEQDFAGRVHTNQAVRVEDNVTGDEVARGKVASLALWYAPRRSATGEMMPMNGDNRTLECIIHIESTSQLLRIGQRVRVQFSD